MGHYLVIQQWSSKFTPSKVQLTRVAVWVHILKLLVDYFGQKVSSKIGKALGRFVKADEHAQKIRARNRASNEADIMKFARICVEVDL